MFSVYETVSNDDDDEKEEREKEERWYWRKLMRQVSGEAGMGWDRDIMRQVKFYASDETENQGWSVMRQVDRKTKGI